MSETKNTGDSTLSVTPTKTLSLKRPVEAGVVRQSFSHGRSKAVVVEKVKRRTIGPADTHAPAPAAAPAAPPAAAPAAPAPAAAAPAAAPAPAPVAAAPAPAAPAPTPVVAAAPAAAPQPAPAAPAAPAPAPVVAKAPAPAAPKPAAPAARPAAAPASQQRQQPSGRSGGPSRNDAPRGGGQRSSSGVVLRSLTEEEREARARALSDSRIREEEERKRAEIEAKARAEREAREEVERAAAEERRREEDARRLQETEAKRRAEHEAKRHTPGAVPAAPAAPSSVPGRKLTQAPAAAAPAAAGAPGAPAARAPEGDDAKRFVRRAPMPVVAPKLVVPRPTRGAEQKNRGRLTVTSATGEESEERTRSVAAFRRRTQRLKGHFNEPKEKLSREVILPETITIQELANRMSERGVDVIKMLMKQGQMAKITDVIDADTAQLIAEELGHTVKRVAEADVEEGLFDTPDIDDHLLPRPPVVTIMGHVDHGKTSLLDAIRQANVVSGEAGGITQHIGAYQVVAPNGDPVTFIDTPGHAAFTAMRARGAKVTDIVILVVAADDGVMPQTIEAIAHARAAGVPMIVAINKIDKPDAKPERVRAELLQYEVQVESMGGDTLEVEVSALQKLNLDKLLDLVALQAELLDLKANPDRSAEGTVIEASLDRGRGPVATVLVQRGTLKVGDIIVGGSHWGRVRALIDDKGVTRQTAGPSMPVEVLGFSGSPEAGDRVAVVESEARAREITEYRDRQKRDKAAATRGGAVRGSLADMMTQLKAAGRKEFPLVIKGDVQGSVEAIIATLEKLNTDEVVARVLHAGVGGITESDITLAEASNAAVLGFNVRAHKEARILADQVGIEIRYYNVIYNLVDDVKAAMSGLLDPTLREDMLGNAQILEVFNISKVGKVAGCRVTDGLVQRGANVRLIRDNVVVHEGKLSTLKRFKDEVKEVVVGQECGMAFESYQDMRVGDVIECYTVTEIKRSL